LGFSIDSRCRPYNTLALPINGQCTKIKLFDMALWLPVAVKGLTEIMQIDLCALKISAIKNGRTFWASVLCVYTCVSKGKLMMLIEHELLKMAGGIHITVPSYSTTASASRCSFNRGSALYQHTQNDLHIGVAVWLSDNALLTSINVVVLRRTRLVGLLKWVTVCGRINQSPRSTQPSTLPGTVK